MKTAKVDVTISDLPAFLAFVERVQGFIHEYARHSRDCDAIDADGDWRIGNPPCDCGYDETIAALFPTTDARVRDLDMVRRMARFGPGPGTTPEQTLNTIAVWAENKLHKLGAWPPGPADRSPKPQPDGGRTHA